MDGLLINSEEYHTKAITELLAKHGRPPLPWTQMVQLQGLPGRVGIAKLVEWAQLPYEDEEAFQLVCDMQSSNWTKCRFLPGALELLQFLHSKGIPIALATSAIRKNYNIKTGHLRHGFDLFGDDHTVVGGDDPRIAPGRGKPHPDIWLLALETINSTIRKGNGTEIKPEECLVFEDGLAGINGAREANFNVIWVPSKEALQVMDGKEQDAVGPNGEVLTSLEQLDKEKYGL